MEYAVGVGLAFGVAVFAALSGFDKDRAFYPTVLVVIATYYDLFAIIGERASALGPETAALGAFVVLSLIGFRTSLWVVVIGLAGHGLFDFVHGQVIINPGVPEWWPMFCLSFDGAIAACLAGRLLSKS